MLLQLMSWTGAAALAAAPFFIDSPEGKLLAIAGLAMLTAQAVKIRAWNLVLLNLSGVAGYTFSLIG